MRLVKIVAGIVGVLVVLVVGVLVYASTLDVNQYKPLMQQKAQEATGRELAIRGDLKLSVGLSPAIAVDGVSFANASWGEKRPMASIERFEAQVSLLPLIFSFGKNIVIDRLVLRGADILLETDAQGKGNWEFQPAGAPKPATPTPAASSGGWQLPVIKRVDVVNAKLVYRDGKTKQVTQLALAKAELSADSDTAPLKLDVAGTYNKLGFTVVGQTGRLIDVMGIGGSGPFPVDVTLALGDRVKATVKGRIAQVQQGKGYDLTIAADIPELGKLSDVAADAGVAGIAVPALGPLKGEIRVTDQAPGGAPSLPAFKVTLGAPDTMRIALEGAVKDPTGLAAKPLRAPGANVTFNGESADLAKLAQRLGQTSPVSGPMKLTGNIADQGTDKVALTGFKFEAAGSDLGGEAQLSIAGARPALTAAFQSAKLDLAKLSGGGGAKPAAAAARPASGGGSSGGRVFPDDPLPFDAMKAADVDVNAKVTELVLPNGMIAKDVRTELVVKDGNLVVDTIKALFGGGTLDGGVRLAQTGAFTVKFKADGLDLGTLVREASGADNLAGGKTDVDLDLRSTGKSVRQLMAGLNGKFALTTGQGAIKSAYVDRIGLDDLMAIVNKSLPKEDSIRLNCVVSRIDIANGMATHRTMVIDTARMTATGRGRINLANEQLDMRAETKTKVTSLLSALPPILIKGTLASPSYAPDIAGAALGAAGALAGGAGSAAGGAGNLVGALTGQRPAGGGQQATSGGDPCAAAGGGAQPAAAPAAASPSQPAPAQPTQPSGGGGPLPGGLPNPFRR